MNLFPSEPVRAKLAERLIDQEGIEYDFAKELAERLPRETMTFSAFVLQAQLLLYDMARGSAPIRLNGFPAPLMAVLAMGLPDLARRCLPPPEAEHACAMIDELRDADRAIRTKAL